jgi:hypothetical protein
MACVSNGLFCNCKAQITLTPFLFSLLQHWVPSKVNTVHTKLQLFLQLFFKNRIIIIKHYIKPYLHRWIFKK